MEDSAVEGKLFRVRLYREDLNFSAGHISTYGEEMEGQHGHNYQLSIEFEGYLGEDALVIDFRTVKRILRSITRSLNHKTLVPSRNRRLRIERGGRSTKIHFGEERIEFPTNSLVFLDVSNVTSEMLAHHLFLQLCRLLPESDRSRLRTIRVEVVESPGQSASYEGFVQSFDKPAPPSLDA